MNNCRVGALQIFPLSVSIKRRNEGTREGGREGGRAGGREAIKRSKTPKIFVCTCD